MTASFSQQNLPSSRPMRGKSLLLPFFLCVLVLAGCDSVRLDPKSTSSFVVSSDDHAPTTEMQVITAIKLVLPAPSPSSGLSWVLVGNNVTVLQQMTGIVRETDAKGTPVDTIKFLSLRPGRSIVRLVLVPPNVKEAIPRDRYSILVVSKDG